jgi:FtsP/CotA-like multicopper oxidase with cupredoxin domain
MRRRDWLGKTIAAGMGVSAARLLEGGPLRSLLGDAAAAEAGVPGTLVATPATIPVWPGHPTTVLTYGGTYPAPTIRAQRGEIVDVLLDNQLGEETNVHWHGLTVPADVDGHPMDVVVPGASKQHTFQIVDRAGTYWYHPHPDMKTASQVYRGMAGFFIVEDPQEAALGLPTGAYDVPLLLQDKRLTADFSLTYAPTMMDMMTGYLGDVALVNGVPEAELTVAAAAYRFRLLNGSNARVFKVAFEDLRTFQVIGGDGGLLERPAPATSVFLAPGERVEIYVDFSRDTAGRTARLVSLPFSAVGRGRGRGMGQGDPMSLLRLVVRGTGPRPPLPATLIPLDLYPRPQIRRQFVMDMTMPPVHGAFTINGLAFDPNRVDVTSDRGVWESWTVINGSAEPHPWHIHAAQFRVVNRTSGPLAPHETALKDTVIVWPAEAVELHVRFDHYPGRYVYHCHNLEHEDMGMMATLEIV